MRLCVCADNRISDAMQTYANWIYAGALILEATLTSTTNEVFSLWKDNEYWKWFVRVKRGGWNMPPRTRRGEQSNKGKENADVSKNDRHNYFVVFRLLQNEFFASDTFAFVSVVVARKRHSMNRTMNSCSHSFIHFIYRSSSSVDCKCSSAFVAIRWNYNWYFVATTESSAQQHNKERWIIPPTVPPPNKQTIFIHIRFGKWEKKCRNETLE